MNYKKLYFNIIHNRRNNPLPSDEYGETHNIKPRSFGGLDTPNNLIRLSTDLPVNILYSLLTITVLAPIVQSIFNQDKGRFFFIIHPNIHFQFHLWIMFCE